MAKIGIGTCPWSLILVSLHPADLFANLQKDPFYDLPLLLNISIISRLEFRNELWLI